MTTITYLGIILFLSLSLWIIYGATYRLYFSPIARFPGPKLAALTLWYEFYFNVIRDGQWIWEIKRMHEEYGPIVRINPYELHIDDPEYYDELYAGNARKREKYLWFVSSSGSPGSSFETIGHDHHRIRRNAVNPFFSKRSIVAMEPLIKSKITLLSNILHSHFVNQTPVNLRVVFSSLTLDVISDYCFGEAFGALTDKNLAEIWSQTLSQIMSITTLVMHLPILPNILSWLPDSMAGPVLGHHRNSRRQVARILNHEDAGGRQNTIFHELRDTDILPPQEKTLSRLADEGNILIGAGGETTAQTLAVLFYHLLDNPKMLSRIKDELSTLDEDITWMRLEKLPFLSAAITEALRLSGVTSRLPRIAPNEDMKFQQWTIPASTPTSMSYYFLHHSPEIFPSPETFDPTRWISDSVSNGSTTGDTLRKHRLDKYFVPFCKGTRICLGINLAYAELFLTTAYVLKRFDLELYGTTKKDVEIKRDHFVAAPAAGSKGIRVIVTGDKGK
ncbi:696affef-5bae-4969-8a8e-53327ef140c5 [Sclerotinia trifoliorum]|uniref:696affef-5bae-4969-8a8e-53327ef140c5 n=1 Tax=Sclerotinia trifoliorum TaxID=28548 RepID=A0A8H2VUE4_9HELO|nr:696affef-5bae-4969-8a8e-53327ef140c5 [Sclerotinia trifoliorum]